MKLIQPEELPSLNLPELNQLYTVADRLRHEEMCYVHKNTKTTLRRMRKLLAELGKISKAARKTLLNLQKGKSMEKYGVEEKILPVDYCPRCGAAVEQHGHVKLCPIHGSEPFEPLPEEEPQTDQKTE